ncbi:MAG: hypothetical protein KAS32_27560, partial [Candidatus Peribacteraceae bacterium]|nr:hypothetical protein [Candidatus Peribacteraceae bacterium]
MAFSYQQGYFKPSNPDKYIGDPNNIVYRSSYELRAFNFIDRNQSITHWGSEEFAIPYISPLDSSPHRYFVDLLIQVEN